MVSKVTNITLNSGNKVPVLGFGTWKSKPGEVKAAVIHAINTGYRHIDCAQAYSNEGEVGEGIADRINAGAVKREDLFVTSKIWNTDHQRQHVKGAIMLSLKNLKLDYLDLYLIHWPTCYVHGKGLFPKDENGKFIYSDDDYVETWKGMEDIQKEGLTRSIGVSNFNEYQINRILKNCSIPPSNNQVESNPYLLNEDMLQFCNKNGISFSAYSPLGSGDRPWAKEDEPKLLEDPKLIEIAQRLGKTTAQVVIRFQIQRGAILLAKSVTPSRIESNLDVFNFELSDQDMETIKGFNRNFRALELGWVSDHKYYPFKENYSEE